MRLGAIIPALSAALICGGCDKTHSQTVELALVKDSNPVPAMAVRLFTAQGCAGTYQDATTSADGRARFLRTVEIGGIGVITDELSVCIPSGSTWQQLYGSLHGPAPKLIELRCDLSNSESKCTETFDGRLMTDSNSDEHDT
jgi:hypothetical protein